MNDFESLFISYFYTFCTHGQISMASMMSVDHLIDMDMDMDAFDVEPAAVDLHDAGDVPFTLRMLAVF